MQYSTSPSPAYLTAYQRRVFAQVLDDRKRIIDALTLHADPTICDAQDDGPDPFKLAAKLEACCRHAQVHADDNEDAWLSERRCRSRLCPRCSKLRSQALTCRIVAALRNMNSPRLLTLTLASSDQPLREQLHRLTDAFKTLRRTDVWKRHFTGGAYTLEITYNHATGRWHPHLHAVCDGSYVRQVLIADAWHRITGDSRIVDIRLVKDRQDAAAYVAGYVAKSSSIQQLPDDRIYEWAANLHGMRMMQTFGAMHGVKLHDDPDIDPARATAAAWADDLADAAAQGNADAAAVLDALVHPDTGLPRPHPRPSSDRPPPRIAAAARGLRAWTAAQQEAADRATPQPRQPRPPDHRRSDGSLRLWQDQPDPAHP